MVAPVYPTVKVAEVEASKLVEADCHLHDITLLFT